MSLPGNINQLLIGAAASGGGVVGPIKSVRFNSPDSQYLNRTFGTATSRTTFTVSFWVKRVDFTQAVYLLTAGTGTQGYITLDAGQIRFYGGSAGDLKTNTDRLFRDASSWYHIVMVADTSNASSDERMRMYINGVQLTNANGDFANYTQPSSGATLGDWNAAGTHYINRLTSGSYGNFYMTDHFFIDGQALEASDFGEFDDNGVWKPKLFSGTYGANGYRLFDFANESGIGNDSSGNNNDWTVNNLTTSDIFRDVCVNHDHEDTGAGGEVSSNYATWNPLTLRLASSSTASLSKGNLHFNTTNTGYAVVVATTQVGPSGKYYCELSFSGTKAAATNYAWFGIVPATSIAAYTSGNNDVDLQRALNSLSMSASKTNSRASKGTGSAQNEVDFNASLGYDENDVIGIGINSDDNILTFYKNGVSFGTFPYLMEPGEKYCFFCVDWANGADIDEYILNAGQQEFAYAAPSGFKALCTSSIPDYTINDGTQHFDTDLYSGNSGTTTISGKQFSPDWVWIKTRSAVVYHNLQDTLRGVDKAVYLGGVAGDDAEATITDAITSFNSDGYTLGSRSTVNFTGRTYAGWSWDAGDSNTSVSAGSLNSSVYNTSENWFTTGTITGTPYSASYTYTLLFDGDLTGLGPQSNSASTQYVYTFDTTLTAPAGTIIFYSTANAVNTNNGMYINGTLVTTSNCTQLNDTSPYRYRMDGLTSLSSIGVLNTHNTTGIEVNGKLLIDSNEHTPPNVPTVDSTYRANPSAGFSIVTYTGNGTDNATFAHGLNAIPEVIIVKRRDSIGDWFVYTLPTAGNILKLNTNDAESASSHFRNMTSSTFQLSGNSDVNHNTGTYVAYCFTPIAGYSFMGYYTGDGTDDGPFINTGFRPAWVMTKSMSAGGDWQIWDSTREPFNYNANTLAPNTTGVESDTSGYKIDFVSNGIKFRQYGSSSNGSGVTYTYLIFAENPFKLNGGIAV